MVRIGALSAEVERPATVRIVTKRPCIRNKMVKGIARQLEMMYNFYQKDFNDSQLSAMQGFITFTRVLFIPGNTDRNLTAPIENRQ